MLTPHLTQLRRARFTVLALAALACGEPTAPRRAGDTRSPMLVGTSINGESRLYTLAPGQGDSAAVSGMGARVGYAAWSPDRKQIAFVDGDSAVVVSAADGSGRVVLFSGRPWRPGNVAWAPDGKRIAFDARTEYFAADAMIAVATVATGAVREVVRGGPAYPLEPTWSPDGRRLMYSAVTNGRRQLHVMNTDGTGARQLIDDPEYWGGAKWSPDGAHVVYVSTRAGPIELWLADADGRRARRLTDATGTVDLSPSWSPDSRAVAFVRSPDVGTDVVMTVRVADGALQEVGFRGYVRFVSW